MNRISPYWQSKNGKIAQKSHIIQRGGQTVRLTTKSHKNQIFYRKFWVLREPSPDPINCLWSVCLSVCGLSVCLSVKVAYGVKLFFLTTNFSEFFCGERSRAKTNLVLSKHFD